MFKGKSKQEDNAKQETITIVSESSTGTKSAEKKSFKDWKRRIGEQALLKFGLASEIKDDVTGNIEVKLTSFQSTAAKALLLEEQCKVFCNCIRSFLNQGAATTFLNDVDDEAKQLSEALSSNYMKGILNALVEHIEAPIDLMRNYIKNIEGMIATRSGIFTSNCSFITGNYI